MKRLLAVLLLLPFLSGCLLYDCGYTRDGNVITYQTEAQSKLPISYSLRFDTCFPPDDEPGTPTSRAIRTKIEEALKATGLFSEVFYEDNNKGGYHIEFTYRDFGYDSEVADARMALYFCTLFMLPLHEDYSADLSAVLYLKGEPVWSIAHAEKCRYVYCWYALPAGLFLNYWSVWSVVENGIVRATVNDFAKEHIKRYLDPASVRLTNPDYAGGE